VAEQGEELIERGVFNRALAMKDCRGILGKKARGGGWASCMGGTGPFEEKTNKNEAPGISLPCLSWCACKKKGVFSGGRKNDGGKGNENARPLVAKRPRAWPERPG